MPDRARMHAANIPRRSWRHGEARARDAARRRRAMSFRMAGLDGVPLTRGGWTFFIPGYDARFSEELREGLIDSAFAAIDGTLATRLRRSGHAETWVNRFGHAEGPQAYFKVLDPIPGLNRARLIFKRRRAAHVQATWRHLL